MSKKKAQGKIQGKAYTLIITEKPQAAQRIAYALATTPIKKNFLGVPYWEVSYEGKKLIIAAAIGHLFSLAEKQPSKEWPVFDLEWKAISRAKRYIALLTHLSKGASDFIIACDYDVEGELIGYNVLRFICNCNDAKRMKFSTLTKPDLLNSFKSSAPHIDFGQAYAGEARHWLDYYYGINLSRALMSALRKAGISRVLSIGRVQGPALALVVERENAIQSFTPQPYWCVFLSVCDSRGHELELKYPENIFKQEETRLFEQLKSKSGQARTEKEEKRLLPLPPFDLTTLQLEAYKLFGLSPAQTLAIAQRLYLEGLISYPRTSSQKLPPTIGYKRILDKLGKLYPKLTKHLVRKYPVEGRKSDSAHPSIFPTSERPAKLSGPERQLYELIVKRFIACFCADALIENKKIVVNVEGKEFFTEGKRILEQGWLAVYPAKFEERELPDVEGKVIIKEVRLEERQTQPPKRYTAASLVAELEKRALGTKATRAVIVDTLYERGYIRGKSIEATKLGQSVVSALEKECPLILDEKLTRKFEEAMNSLQEEQDKRELQKKEKKILEEAKKLLLAISKNFKEREQAIGQELLRAYVEVSEEEKKVNALCVCPLCKKGQLIILRSKKGKRFTACSCYPNCKASYALPQYGLIKLAEKNCSCGFPLLLLIRKGKPPWQFCFNPECKERRFKKT